MTTVFLSGSRSLSRLSQAVKLRIDNIIENNFLIVTGDANGADKAMQKYLAEKNYENVTIYFVGRAPRNNIGNWSAVQVKTDRKIRDRHYFAQKDFVMSQLADFGLIVWDGQSSGSIQNAIWLLEHNTKFLVYCSNMSEFSAIKSDADMCNFIMSQRKDIIENISKKISIPYNILNCA